MHVRWSMTLVLLLVGCGSTAANGEPSSAADEKTEPAAAVSGGAKKKHIPKKCAKGKSECVPPSGWVKRLCDDVYPDVALHMFKPGTPWKRLYMLARAEPFNASGGASLLGERL